MRDLNGYEVVGGYDDDDWEDDRDVKQAFLPETRTPMNDFFQQTMIDRR